ncbi:hypothetical protein [Smaragdicoccus niigatensis]|uniref:hypothetical protein n=1 Tax=Smaragdicoccus niigatensis TaxID=359359 RepID=UPI000380D58A|nr:hypothetical protein [Smaragdicoccus niigatensis]
MIKRPFAKIPVALAVAAAGLTIAAPASFAAGPNDGPPPGGILGQIFGFLLFPPPPQVESPHLFPPVPVEAIPYVDVPDSWFGTANNIGQQSNDFILNNQQPIEQGAGAVGGAICTITPILGAPCSPIP